jgi:hypothetical protein
MKIPLKKGSTHFLRLALFGLGLIVLAVCIFGLPNIYHGSAEYPVASASVLAIIVGLYVTVIPFYVALWQTLKLLGYIDRGTAFSHQSVTALRNIKRCATVISIIYVAFVPLIYPLAEVDDAPGLIPITAVIACAPIVVAVFAAVLERLLRDAIKFKSENDLTV